MRARFTELSYPDAQNSTLQHNPSTLEQHSELAQTGSSILFVFSVS